LERQISERCEALANAGTKTAYFDGELCGMGDDDLPSFSRIQAASDGPPGVRLVYFRFDLLHLDGRDITSLPLIDTEMLLESLVAAIPNPMRRRHRRRRLPLALELTAEAAPAREAVLRDANQRGERPPPLDAIRRRGDSGLNGAGGDRSSSSSSFSRCRSRLRHAGALRFGIITLPNPARSLARRPERRLRRLRQTSPCPT
jgi:hypothetical protein